MNKEKKEMKKLHVYPGVCGLDTVITAETNEDEEIVLDIRSKCPAAGCLQHLFFQTRFG